MRAGVILYLSSVQYYRLYAEPQALLIRVAGLSHCRNVEATCSNAHASKYLRMREKSDTASTHTWEVSSRTQDYFWRLDSTSLDRCHHQHRPRAACQALKHCVASQLELL